MTARRACWRRRQPRQALAARGCGTGPRRHQRSPCGGGSVRAGGIQGFTASLAGHDEVLSMTLRACKASASHNMYMPDRAWCNGHCGLQLLASL